MMKSGLIPEAQIEKELATLFNPINPAIISKVENTQTDKLTSVVLSRIAEAGRVALHYNLIAVA